MKDLDSSTITKPYPIEKGQFLPLTLMKKIDTFITELIPPNNPLIYVINPLLDTR